MRTSIGALHTERMFLARNRVGDAVMSAQMPAVKVKVAMRRPRMVRYWKCHPNDSLLCER
jgi:hypothetical protein